MHRHTAGCNTPHEHKHKRAAHRRRARLSTNKRRWVDRNGFSWGPLATPQRARPHREDCIGGWLACSPLALTSLEIACACQVMTDEQTTGPKHGLGYASPKPFRVIPAGVGDRSHRLGAGLLPGERPHGLQRRHGCAVRLMIGSARAALRTVRKARRPPSGCAFGCRHRWTVGHAADVASVHD